MPCLSFVFIKITGWIHSESSNNNSIVKQKINANKINLKLICFSFFVIFGRPSDVNKISRRVYS